jgi:hypothetical protein
MAALTAEDRVVAGRTIGRQCLDLGLLDEVAVDLGPFWLTTGITASAAA